MQFPTLTLLALATVTSFGCVGRGGFQDLVLDEDGNLVPCTGAACESAGGNAASGSGSGNDNSTPFDCSMLSCDDGDPCNGQESCSATEGCLPGSPLSGGTLDPSFSDDGVILTDLTSGADQAKNLSFSRTGASGSEPKAPASPPMIFRRSGSPWTAHPTQH
ncbi:MAG: hypothetical protein AAF658_10770 [Myxococcota bacterium]